MKDRIKEYMDFKSISAGELANILEVQRSNVSHVLNGRNLPGAFFIEKLLINFPDLNARWLLTGEGKMTVEAITEGDKIKIESEKLITDKTEIQYKANNYKSSLKSIEKIVVLYTDGTFTDYNKMKIDD